MSSDLNEGLNKLRLRSTGCDVIFEIGSQSFLAHRVVLMARLEYFENMFTADIKEKKESIVSLDPRIIDSIYFGEVLNYIYTSKICFTHNNLRSICKIADYFCFGELTNKANKHIQSSMTFGNVSFYRSIAIDFGLKSWKSVSTKFNFKHIFNDIHRCSIRKNVPSFSFEQIEVSLQKLKEMERLEDMFHYSADWVLHDHINRSLMLPDLLKNIPLNKLSFHFLTKIVPNCDLIKKDNECRDWLLDAIIDYDYNSDSDTNTLYAIGGKDGEILSSVSEYNNKSRTWTASTPMLNARTHFSCAVIGQKIYVCGGYNGQRSVNELAVFDTHTQRWRQLISMKYSRYLCAAAILNGKIYVAGGLIGQDQLSVVERYCVETGRWEVDASMTAKRSELELVALNGYLYAIGGFDGYNKLHTVERYDPQADKWIKMNNMNNRFSSFGSTVLNGRIYIVGRYACEMYSPTEDKWTEMPAPSKCGDGRRLAAYDGKLYAIGGRVLLAEQHDWRSKKTVEVFDFKTRVWQPGTDMDVARCFHRVVAVEE